MRTSLMLFAAGVAAASGISYAIRTKRFRAACHIAASEIAWLGIFLVFSWTSR